MSSPRILSLRYDGKCSVCESQLARRTQAWWYPEVKKIVCLDCRPVGSTADATATNPASEDPFRSGALPLESEVEPTPQPEEPEAFLISDGQAGASARREGERRRSKRQRDTLERHPHLGKLILAASDEPQAVRAWTKGARGEEALGAKLTKLANERLVVLHDRKIPGSRANIDHIAITPSGVFVIDSKHYSGRVQQRDLGGWFRTDLRLYVGRRDCTKLVHSAEDQAEIIRNAVASLGFGDIPARPVLCFISAEWGLFASPFKHGSVLITWPKALYDLLKRDADVETATIQETARQLAEELPSA